MPRASACRHIPNSRVTRFPGRILGIYQYLIDTYVVQHSAGSTRAITIAFGLIGLYLALEKGYSGKQVRVSCGTTPGTG